MTSCVAQAGLKRIGPSDPPAVACPCVGLQSGATPPSALCKMAALPQPAFHAPETPGRFGVSVSVMA